MLGLSLGLGRGFLATPPNSVSPQQVVCAAIKGRKHVVATIDGQRVILQPYALIPGEGSTILDAVLVVDEREPIRGWRIHPFKLSDVAGISPRDLGFIPNGAFRAGARKYRDAICSIQPVESFDDAF